ncbi:CdiA family toxin C-terminal domain-containing protein [Clostridium beijerinckii]|jgi:hypothetical protein|uniref:Bacterial EndoU nuclease domain-containing protein n=1 Tax=Clostridium beijerinckii (strain ATCC 51743 / NCIMB 8052) TaxID=290402 RepID=A6LWQ7_CLOB8|nr:CdiA family toxin C-terminal domain-containing protein [Clostridium beijerinckii]ABR34787.1 hypothetical protein Cbei_2633 [Clostridium beijerinckii NCIMB 8052]AIU00701.1 hypothetical protein Cbs_2633 [Clostridium beijerinckii ATCC 35702]NRT23858.1 hypothetical protein [Clostridium beijerinckii]NRT68559.1 hypothetical protein [Clostridium beijerinckii]NRT86148.1 hypothetical protein [Clostridium beijerinckii]
MGVSKSSNLLESESGELVPTTSNLPGVQNINPPTMNFNSNMTSNEAMIVGNNPLLLNDGAGKVSWKLGKPMSEIPHTISSNAKTHLIAENKPISGKKGVTGTHNEFEFYNKLESTGKNIDKMISTENIVYDKDFQGLKTIEYKIPKGDGKNGFLDEYKIIKEPKTVYNPTIYSDEQMYQWGLEAMENGYLDGYLICGEASNGMKFMGYFRNGEVTNFHPVTSFD